MTTPASHPAPPSSPVPSVAIVTAGSRGIGHAIATRLGADGFTVGVHYVSHRDAASATVAKIEAAGGTAFAFNADLATEEAGSAFWQSCDAAAAQAGVNASTVTVLVNNAGITLRGTIEDLSYEDFVFQQAVNVNAPYFLVREALPRLGGGGRVINISSGATRIADPETIGYALTKGAIDAFTVALAKHLDERGITVNAVSPGVVQAGTASASGRGEHPDDIAGVVSFLASPDSGWITGQVIDATGGTSLGARG